MRAARATALSIALTAALVGATTTAGAAGPSSMAQLDGDLWQSPVDRPAGFDRASRASLLVYARALRDAGARSDADLRAGLHLKSVDRASLDRWLRAERGRAFANYRLASTDCGERDWTCVGPTADFEHWVTAADKALAAMPADKRAWRSGLEGFVSTYLDEQLRLAALFPKTSSEIGTFNAGEWTSEGMPDRSFQLSFDDGPTPAGGHTDDTLAMLRAHGQHALFFMLGGNLKQRVAAGGAPALKTAFRGQCIASHGWEHRSHAKWPEWQGSVRDTEALLHSTFDADMVSPYFRPPYAQRPADSGAFFASQTLQVALWNIDSQDWSAKMAVEALPERLIALMLIKRHGVLLFHDIHGKAAVALPQVFARTGSAVQWSDCRRFGAMTK